MFKSFLNIFKNSIRMALRKILSFIFLKISTHTEYYAEKFGFAKVKRHLRKTYLYTH